MTGREALDNGGQPKQLFVWVEIGIPVDIAALIERLRAQTGQTLAQVCGGLISYGLESPKIAPLLGGQELVRKIIDRAPGIPHVQD